MHKRKTTLIVSLAVLVISAALLITGSSVLMRPVIQDPYMPLGNLIAWSGIVSLPTSIYIGINRFIKPNNIFDRGTRFSLLCLILVAILWAPISYVLSGNFAFIFDNNPSFQGSQLASKIFWYFNYAIILSPIIILLIYGLFQIKVRISKTGD